MSLNYCSKRFIDHKLQTILCKTKPYNTVQFMYLLTIRYDDGFGPIPIYSKNYYFETYKTAYSYIFKLKHGFCEKCGDIDNCPGNISPKSTIFGKQGSAKNDNIIDEIVQ